MNHPTHVLVELRDATGRLCSLNTNVTAKFEQINIPQHRYLSLWHTQFTNDIVAVSTMSPSQYKISYTVFNRGQHKLHVHVNDKEINGSPIIITMYPDPTELGHQVVITGFNKPYGIAYNSCREIIVSEWGSNKISILDIRGQKIRTFGSRGDSPDQMEHPAGIAVDDMDNIYVSSQHKLQKFTSSGKLINCVGCEGGKEGEFNDPRGVALYANQVYVCDRYNHRIQVFDLDLNVVRSIGSHGKGKGEFHAVDDVKFDTDGNMYITEHSRVQVLDNSGQFIRAFSEEGEGKLRSPSGLHIADKYVYVSDYKSNCILVYKTSGEFVVKLGGQNLNHPRCITSCVNGYIYVCDWNNDEIKRF